MTVTERPLETGWLPDTPVEDTLLRGFVHNQGSLNQLLADAKGGRSARSDDVFLADADSAVPYFNQAILTRPLAAADDPVLDEVEAFYEPTPRPATLLSVWPTPDLRPRGWTLVGHPAVVVRAPAAMSHELPPRVRVEAARDAGALAAAERVLIKGYPLEDAAGEPPGSELPPTLTGSRLVVRLGLLDGEPVAIGMAYVGHGLVNLCGGATLPAARRQGVWRALVAARVADGPDLPAVAYTSDYSRPGFVRMGFLPVTRFTLWLRSP